MKLRFILSLITGLLFCSPAYSHHSPESHYLVEEMITVTGVVTKFRLINPHARIYFDVTATDGEVQHWFAEGNASAILRRRGWNNDSLKPGDVIEISGNPARDGGPKMDWKLIVTKTVPNTAVEIPSAANVTACLKTLKSGVRNREQKNKIFGVK